MTRKLRSDSATMSVDNFIKANASIAIPEGVELRSDEEKTIWEQFTRARARNSWRDFDLVLLAKVVRLEADIRKYQVMLDTSGPLIKNKRETVVENPLLRVIDTMQRQQLAIIRSMSLNQQGVDPRTMNDNALIEQDARDTVKSFDAESLLALPIRH